VLGIAGKLLRDARTAAAAGAGPLVDATTEAQIVIRATRVTTLPKLTFADGRRFADLLNDVYPGVEVSDVSDAELEAAIQEVLEEKHYENVPSQIEKVFNCTSRVRSASASSSSVPPARASRRCGTYSRVRIRSWVDR
jgi:dynein heavy chain 2